MIIIENAKLASLLEQKNELVKEGRKISSELETLEFKITKCQDKEKVITAKTEAPELMTKAKIIEVEIDVKMKEFDAIAKKIENIKLEAIPADLKDKHKALIKTREEKERDRNKVALKIQKIKDKFVPILKKEIAPHLGEYDDTETVEVKDGKVIVNTFNYLDDFKSKFKNKKY